MTAIREGKHRKPIHLAAHFPGVNNTTVWSDPESGSQIEFDSFVHLARTAERGLFDFFFLAEGLRLREHRGRIHDLDVVGRPDTFTVLAALAGVTDRLGLTGTINTTFNEPFEVARQFATLDHLSDGRAGWNMVTSSDAFTGENFRRGGFLDHSDRYKRAEEFITVAREFWDSWAPDAVRRRPRQRNLRRPRTGFAPSSTTVRSSTCAVSRRCRPRRRVIRCCCRPATPPTAGRSAPNTPMRCSRCTPRWRRDSATTPTSRRVRRRYGRDPDRLKVFPAATFVLGDTAEEAADKARHIRYQQVGRPTAIAMLEQVWQRDLSGYDPDGPLPDVEPADDPTITQGRVRHGDPKAVAAAWRERAEAENLSIRELVIAVTSRQQFVGTPAQVADEIDLHVQSDACDGFILVPHLTPHGLDDFVDRVVPLLQERGSFPHRIHRAYPARSPRPIGWPEGVGDSGGGADVDFADDGGVAAPCRRRSHVRCRSRIAFVRRPPAGSDG